MTFLDDYTQFTKETAVYPASLHGAINYVALGLAGEAGEVANEVKKVASKDRGHLTEARRASILDECGDVLWYLTRLIDELGSSLEVVAWCNRAKLIRRSRGKK